MAGGARVGRAGGVPLAAAARSRGRVERSAHHAEFPAGLPLARRRPREETKQPSSGKAMEPTKRGRRPAPPGTAGGKLGLLVPRHARICGYATRRFAILRDGSRVQRHFRGTPAARCQRPWPVMEDDLCHSRAASTFYAFWRLPEQRCAWSRRRSPWRPNGRASWQKRLPSSPRRNGGHGVGIVSRILLSSRGSRVEKAGNRRPRTCSAASSRLSPCPPVRQESLFFLVG